MGSFNLGKFGTMTTLRNKEENINYGFISKGDNAYIFKGETFLEFEKNMIKNLEANNYFELAKKIKENGLIATSKYYQTLENKTEGGNK